MKAEDLEKKAEQLVHGLIHLLAEAKYTHEDASLLCGEMVVRLLARMCLANAWGPVEFDEVVDGLQAEAKNHIIREHVEAGGAEKLAHLLQGGKIQ